MNPRPPSESDPPPPAPATRVSTSLLQRWQRVPTAIVADLSQGVCQIDPAIRPLCPPGHQPGLCGPALTVHCLPLDIGAVTRALDIAQPGEVLVIAADARQLTATIGAILGGYLRSRGAAGLICDGAIRDVAELAAWRDFSVFTRYITARGPTSFVGGEVNCPVVFGGRRVSPGDLIMGDDDGLVSLTLEEATDLIDAAEAKLEVEKQWRQRLANGLGIGAALGLSSNEQIP